MHKPEFRIIEFQSEQNTDESFSEYEKNYLLSKYGYSSDLDTTKVHHYPNDVGNMTYDEFVKLSESKSSVNNKNKVNIPKSYTIENVNYHESKFADLDLDGVNFGIQIQVFSDMPINNTNKL